MAVLSSYNAFALQKIVSNAPEVMAHGARHIDQGIVIKAQGLCRPDGSGWQEMNCVAA
jgi:hypothetical protein